MSSTPMLPSSILFTALTAQFIFIGINWCFFKRKEYAFYMLYIVAVSFYYLNKYAVDEAGIVHLGAFRYHHLYLDKILAIVCYIFYFKFGRYYVEAHTRYPVMNKRIRVVERLLAGYVVFDIFLLAAVDSFAVETALFLPVNACLSLFLAYVFWSILKKNEVLDRFIVWGSIFYAISATLTVWLGHHLEAGNDKAFLILQIGTLNEMMFLNAGIVYKSKMLHNQAINAQRQLIDRYRENENLLLRLAHVRERLSRDLHDDVGATLSSIKAYSEILKSNPDNVLISELINHNSTEMIEKLEMIAWATNPQYDSLKCLVNQMKKFAVPLCHSYHIQFQLYSDGLDEQMLMPGELRQTLLLIFKEAVNNSIKYSEATTLTVKFSLSKDFFSLQIADDGKGFDGKIKGTGHGWKNMQHRAMELKGVFRLDSICGKGTTLCIQFPFPFEIPNSWDS